MIDHRCEHGLYHCPPCGNVSPNKVIKKEQLEILKGGYSVITKDDLEIYSFCMKYGLNYDEIYSKINNK